MRVKIGSKTYTATLDDTATTAKLREMLPLTIEMAELNGNEKFYKLPTALPTDAANPGTIRTGDLMLWGADTLVLFYETFRPPTGTPGSGGSTTPPALRPQSVRDLQR
jgi:hypothetical protein